MAKHDYEADIKKYAANVDAKAIAGIVKHLGIAVKIDDASLVACSDKSERDRVRDSFLKKKLALTEPDAALDKAVQEICQTMHASHDKLRVTFYYLLAEKYGKLGLFTK
jgi:Protein of unknown function (DUF2853)